MLPIILAENAKDPIAALLTAAGVVVAALLTGFFGWLIAKNGKKATEQTSKTADWEGFTTRLQEQLKSVDDRVKALQERVDQLEKDKETHNRKYAGAIDYIRQLLHVLTDHLPQYPAPVPPKDIAGDI